MIQACDALDIIRTKNRDNPKWINQRLYRLLYNPTIHIMAYERLKSKPGNMTPGSDGKTLDGYSLGDIQKLIGLDNCAICGSQEQENVEMHHVRHIRKRGEKVQGFTLYMAAINRKQVPVCRKCHREIHNGKYDGASLSSILEQLRAPYAII